MRWILGVALAVGLAAPGLAAGQGERCHRADPKLARADPRGASFQRLDRLLPAAEIRTVLRAVDGCEGPVVVRYGIGGRAPTVAPPR